MMRAYLYSITFLLSLSICATGFVTAQELTVAAYPKSGPQENLEEEVVDYRYAPLYWQSIIGLPSDPHKSLVASDGTLLYNFDGLAFDFKIPEPDYELRITAKLVGTNEYTPYHQSLYDPKVPVILTESRIDGLTLHQTAWARAPEFDDIDEWAPRRVDYQWLRMVNETRKPKEGQVMIEVADASDLVWDGKQLSYGKGTKAPILIIDPAPESVIREGDALHFYFEEKQIMPGEAFEALVTLFTAKFDKPFNHYADMLPAYDVYQKRALSLSNTSPFRITSANQELDRAIKYWLEEANLPYGRIAVPDQGVQALLDASIRNIYQASELKNGNFIIQIGPGHYRGSWAADGPFFMESLTYLGRWKEARVALESQFDNDTTDPAGLTFYKRSGLRLWMVQRHAELTGDTKWLESVWPKVQRDVDLIKVFRKRSLEDDTDLNDGLMPRGAGDGGLGGRDVGTRVSEGMSNYNEYTNVYWNLAGLKSAIDMAEQLQKTELANWKSEYADFYAAFERAAERDMLLDAFGNPYVPVTMRDDVPQLPQRGAWAYMHSVYPGEIYEQDDPILRGMMDMFDAAQRQGTVYGTGWLAHGIWNYFSSFYGHAHLWMGHGQKAAATLYSLSNHASPTYVWVEEQYPVGQMRGEDDWGDMPHNWAAAEYIRFVRHLLIFERNQELHLLEGMPPAWAQPSAIVDLQKIPTSFGDLSMNLEMADDGQSATITIDPPDRDAPDRLVLHLEQFDRPIWKVTSNGMQIELGSQLELDLQRPIKLTVEFAHLAEGRYVKPIKY